MTAWKERSMVGELMEGMVDGKYKRVVLDRSNRQDPDRKLQRAERTALNAGVNGYGIFEAPVKRTGDGRFASTSQSRESPGVAEG
jgi:hypothetical protein